MYVLIQRIDSNRGVEYVTERVATYDEAKKQMAQMIDSLEIEMKELNEVVEVIESSEDFYRTSDYEIVIMEI